jgi:N-acetylmuramate 1-kinase
MTTDLRLNLLLEWLSTVQGIQPLRIAPASADASFRRYFRLWLDEQRTWVAMDAPPDKEDLAGYLRVSTLLVQCGVHVPHVEAFDLQRGFALLEDLGSTQMLGRLARGGDPDPLYRDALRALADLQLRGMHSALSLAYYDEVVLRREMDLMPEWFCHRHLGIDINAGDQRAINSAFAFLIDAALSQPQVFVHRDYHSRNLMIVDERSPGIIDFQDALRGPVGYDLVSILKDCYVSWPRAQIESWAAVYRNHLLADKAIGVALAGDSLAQMLRWMDLIGLQRHIKVLGIFARLNWRDGKSAYLADLPRTLEYVRETAARFPELRDFSHFVEQQLVPALASANARAMARAS